MMMQLDLCTIKTLVAIIRGDEHVAGRYASLVASIGYHLIGR
jgi:hypothetical protein